MVGQVLVVERLGGVNAVVFQAVGLGGRQAIAVSCGFGRNHAQVFRSATAQGGDHRSYSHAVGIAVFASCLTWFQSGVQGIGNGAQVEGFEAAVFQGFGHVHRFDAVHRARSLCRFYIGNIHTGRASEAVFTFQRENTHGKTPNV
ncbi:hypothetical protein D3C84_644380 [compost metagenome]